MLIEGVNVKKNNKKTNIKKKVTFIKSIKTNVKDLFYNIKNDPATFSKGILINIRNYIVNNKYFCLFVIINLLNAILLRYFTIGGVKSIFKSSPFLADLSLLLIFGGLGYLMSEKKRIIYYVVLSFILMLLCTINSSYYTFYTSFASISLLPTTKFIFAVGDAVVENVVKIRDIIYPTLFGILIICYVLFSKKRTYELSNKKSTKNILIVSTVTICMFLSTLTASNIGGLVKQWNREYIVNIYGIYVYHINDFIKSIEPKVTSLFGYDKALKVFNDYYEEFPAEEKKNQYTNKFEGKNVIGIHAESIQGFAIGLKLNGQEVTPNLNKLISKGLYFSNFYSQVSVGTSSDTEFAIATSLMPSNSGTAFGSYFDRTYVAMPQLLKGKGYYTFSMHGNNGDYWNRKVMHKNLGYDHFYAKDEFNIDETIGLGLSDHSFFIQGVDKLKTISSEHDKFYGTFIMLTNHTPFSETGKYGEFDVSMTVDGVKYSYLEGTKLGNYLKSVHYADKCLGEFIENLRNNGLLENTVIFIYGDHDARLPKEDYERYYNYDYINDTTINEEDPNYKEFTDYDYELNRKVPFIIWSDDMEKGKEIKSVMGMYDVMPTLGNMLGISNKYALGQDIFNHLDNNVVVFPTGNWLTNQVYYNNQKKEYMVLSDSVITEDYIKEYNNYSDKLLSVSNAIIVYDLIAKSNQKNVNEAELLNK